MNADKANCKNERNEANFSRQLRGSAKTKPNTVIFLSASGVAREEKVFGQVEL
jgi:hypothetical protein